MCKQQLQFLDLLSSPQAHGTHLLLVARFNLLDVESGL